VGTSAVRLANAGEYVEWLRVQIHEKSIPSTDRTRTAAACLGLAQEHHHAIVLLAEHRLYGSAFSLLRVAFEAYIRGEWLHECASDAQVEQFVRGGEPPSIGVLLEQLEQLPAFNQRTLSAVKQAHWKAMCAYTHSGGLHTQRWQTSSAVEANYSPEEVDEVIVFAEIVGSLSAIAIAGLANDEQTANTILQRFEQRAQ
jgi:hypothetical protein